jgi:hypothetical protein
MADEEHEHEGTFAEGVERDEHHPEREGKGRFARRGEEGGHVHEGAFAEGVEREEHHAESERRGRFAEGEDE